jgi:hypothetical protein
LGGQPPRRVGTVIFTATEVPPRVVEVSVGDAGAGAGAALPVDGPWREIGAGEVLVAHVEPAAGALAGAAVREGEVSSRWELAGVASAWVMHSHHGVVRAVPRALAQYAAAGGVLVVVDPAAPGPSERAYGRGRWLTRPSPPDASWAETLDPRPLAMAFPPVPGVPEAAPFGWVAALAAGVLAAGAWLAARRLAWVVPAIVVAAALLPLPGGRAVTEAAAVELTPVPELGETYAVASVRARGEGAARWGEAVTHRSRRFLAGLRACGEGGALLGSGAGPVPACRETR